VILAFILGRYFWLSFQSRSICSAFEENIGKAKHIPRKAVEGFSIGLGAAA
jgi:hypothetical protein